MKDLPIKAANSLKDLGIISPQFSLIESQKNDQEKIALGDNDASKVSIPKSKQISQNDQGLESVLSSFLGEIKNEKEASLAHSNLDASRVMDLLADSDES